MAGKCDEVTLVYDAAPYILNEDIEDARVQLTTYVDTMAKILECFSEFRFLTYTLLDKHQFCFTLENVDDITRWNDAILLKVMRDLNQACIHRSTETPYYIEKTEVKDRFGKGMLYKGWNYTAMSDKAEPSLYFTYAVCSAYMSLTSNIAETLSAVRAEEKKREVSDENAAVIPSIVIENNAAMERDYRFLQLIYAEFVKLNKCCVDAGRYVDTMLRRSKIDITQEFVGQNYTKVTVSEIENSTTNDAMIHTLLAMLILLYTGVDLDYITVGKLKDFEDMFQYSVQNILKVYKKLERANKSYIIDQLILNFTETMPAELQEQVKYIRKQRIFAISLLPLLVKSFTAMSRYIIEYPQKEMGDYLSIILENRCLDKNTGTPLWIWDKDGYNLQLNFLYMLNVLSFYTYYEKYEYPFTGDTDSFNVKLETKEKSHQAELQSVKDAYQAQIDALKADLERAKVEAAQPAPLETEVERLIDRYLSAHLNDLLIDTFRRSRIQAIDVAADGLTTAFRDLFLATLVSPELRNMADAGMAREEGKCSTNKSYTDNEATMFELFRQMLLTRLKNQG